MQARVPQLTISGVLKNAVGGSSAAILTKKGPGTLAVTNAGNTFSGMTNLTAGTLIDTGALPGGITMSTGTTLAGTGTIDGTVTDASGVIIAPGPTGAAGSVGTFTFGQLYRIRRRPDQFRPVAMSLGRERLVKRQRQLVAYRKHQHRYQQINGINSLASGSYRLINYTGI